MTETRPELSVVLQVGGQRPRAVECLASLLGQDQIARMEIILLDYGLGGHKPLQGSDHPAVRVIGRTEYEPFGTSRALGVQHARAAVVAFIEDHCVALDGWARSIIAAHNQGWKVIGCEMHTGNPGIGISDAIALMNYARWLPPARSGVESLLPGHNVAYDRELLLSFRGRLPELLNCDPLLMWKIQEMGHDLYLEQGMKVAHTNETEVGVIARGYYNWNRLFAVNRAASFKWPALKKFAWVALFPLIPPVRIAKLLVFLLRRRPGLLGSFLRSLPVQVIAQYAAAVGQAVGFLSGPGEAAVKFLDYELNQVRRVA